MGIQPACLPVIRVSAREEIVGKNEDTKVALKYVKKPGARADGILDEEGDSACVEGESGRTGVGVMLEYMVYK